MFPKTGKDFPFLTDRISESEFSTAIAVALQAEFGMSRHAEKTIAKWTGANNRSARNWMAGINGPTGAHLMALARQSDLVFKAIVLMSGRPASTLNVNLQALHDILSDTIDVVNSIIGDGQAGPNQHD